MPLGIEHRIAIDRIEDSKAAIATQAMDLLTDVFNRSKIGIKGANTGDMK
jgi:hypothetical protein